MRLGAKLRASYIGIVCFAVTLVLVIVIEDSFRTLREKIGKDLQAVSEIEADNFNYYVQQKENTVKKVGREIPFLSTDKAFLSGYMLGVQDEDRDFLALAILSETGEVTVSTFPEEIQIQLPEDMIRDAMDMGPETLLARIEYVFTDRQEPQLMLLWPLGRRSARAEKGFVFGLVELDRILSFDQEQRTEALGKRAHLLNIASTMIITQDGESKSFSPLVYLQQDPEINTGELAGYISYRDESGAKALAGFAFLEENGISGKQKWAVISKIPQKKILAPAIRLRNKMIVLGIGVIVVAWVISFVVAQGITRPLRKLVQVTDGIAKGALARRADTGGDDEVRDLAVSFNKMTDKLNNAIVERDQEIIERKNAEEELLEGIEAKNNFVNMIYHEFRTPLVAVKEGVARVLEASGGNLGEQEKQILELARKSGESLQKLVGDIVKFHDLTTDKEKIHLEENDLNAVVQDIHQAMLPLIAEKKGVSFMVDLDDTIPRVAFDRKKIELALANIVNVSIKNTEKGSVLVKTSRMGDNTVRVSVEDTGEAADTGEMGKFFDSFETAGKKRDKKAGGSGMGLAIARAIIKQHRGKIWAEAEGEKGIVVSFVLPVDERRRREQ